MSFAAMIDRVLAERPELVVRSEAVDDADMAALRSFFAAHNVAIERRPGSEGDEPAVLRRDGERLAESDLENLVAYVTMAEEATTPAIVEAVSTETVALPAADRSRLLRSSRQIETRAWRSETGTLHACFQQLSRFRAHAPTEQLYRRVGAAGVDVNLVGQPDATVAPSPGVTIHEREAEVVGRTWFVVYRDSTSGALLAQERAPDRYTGFWTFEDDLVEEVAAGVREVLE